MPPTAADQPRLMPAFQRPAGLDALQKEIDDLRGRLARLEAEAGAAKQEAQQAREEVLRLRDQLAAAERDQQDLRTARARLSRISVRGLLARILNRPP